MDTTADPRKGMTLRTPLADTRKTRTGRKRGSRKSSSLSDTIISLLIIAGTAVWFFQFTHAGYMKSVPYRASFERLAENVYVNRDYAGDKTAIPEIVERAKARDAEFFGELECLDETVVIICDDEAMIKKLGYDHHTNSYWFPVKKSYICVSDEYLNDDILAHEFTHAELYSRVSSRRMAEVPTWFNEGLAMQNDLRGHFGEEYWRKITNNGKSTVAHEDMDEAEEFYADPAEERMKRYICSKHEVSIWLGTHGIQGLMELIDRINKGEDFGTAYSG